VGSLSCGADFPLLAPKPGGRVVDFLSEEGDVMRRNREMGACLCSELVTARWMNAFGQRQETVVNLEEIWAEGATLQFEYPMRPGAEVEFLGGSSRFVGTVAESRSDFVGHFVEIRFADGYRWSRELYEPDHFFDPASLSPVEELRTKNNKLLEEVLQKIQNRVA